MKLSTETYVLRERFDDRTAVKMIKDAGFDCFDYLMYWVRNHVRDMLGDNYIEKAKDLRKYADSLGICCNRPHAPFDFTEKILLKNQT